MSDLIEQADEAAKGLFAVTDSIVEYYERQAIKLFPQLVAEIKRLQDRVEYLDKRDARTLQEYGDLQEQLAAWQKIAIDRTAQIGWQTSCNCGRLQDTLEWDYCDWTREIPQSIRDGWNTWAAKELGLQVKQEAGYVERLEKALVDAIYERRKVSHGHSWYHDDESYDEYLQRIENDAREKAQAVLEKIRRG